MKQIFDWLREQIVHTANDVSPNTDKLLVLYGVEKLINKAEAKWEKEHCIECENCGTKVEKDSNGDYVCGRCGRNTARLRELEEEADCCEWKLEDAEANLYVTSCEQRHLIFEDTPKENGYRFCPYCGRKIAEVE